MTKKIKKKPTAASLLRPTAANELASLLGTSIGGTATIPAVGVTYELKWEVRGGQHFAALRVVKVNRRPNIGALKMTTLR